MISGGYACLNDESLNLYTDVIAQKKIIGNCTEDEKKIIDQFKAGSLILDDDNNEIDILRYNFLSSIFGSKHLALTILPTLKCNFNCSYCFEANKKATMQSDVAKAIKEYVEKKIVDEKISQLFVNWFGGEPLLEFEVMQDLSLHFMKICKDNNIEYGADMISNCWFLTPEIAQKLVEIGVKTTQVTIDGYKEMHDSKRMLQSRAPTFNRIIENVLNCSDKILFTIRINIDKYTISSIDRVFEDLSSLSQNKSICVYPGLLKSDATVACKNIENSCLDIKEFADIMPIFHRSAIEHGFGLSWYRSATVGGCCATSPNAMVIEPSGNLCRCWSQVGEAGESFGNIKNFNESFKPQNYYKWILHDPFANKDCVNCQYFPICWGGCAADWINHTTDYMKPNSNRKDKCSVEKYNLKEMLLLYYEHFQNQQASQEQKSEK